MDAPKCKLCGERHWGMCPTDTGKLTESIERCIAEGRVKRRESAERAKTEMLAMPIGRPRIEDKGQSFEATKPWLALGMSRTTWYRRRKESAIALARENFNKISEMNGTDFSKFADEHRLRPYQLQEAYDYVRRKLIEEAMNEMARGLIGYGPDFHERIAKEAKEQGK